ncbi:MAG: hypothetical protein JSV33_04470 [bacterium]|nr:MAG: hypothetical protein JSV33_04470 [bacterium]
MLDRDDEMEVVDIASLVLETLPPWIDTGEEGAHDALSGTDAGDRLHLDGNVRGGKHFAPMRKSGGRARCYPKI